MKKTNHKTEKRKGRSPKPKTRGMSHEKTARTRAALVRASVEEFLKHGFASATIARVAKRAGLAKGTLYLYFKTKEELFTGVVRDFVISPLWGTENQSIQDNERVGDFFRRTILPVVRDIESGNRAAVARLVLAESSKFPFLAEVYRKEAYEPFLKHISVFAKLAYKRGEIGACPSFS